jgi:hypothetical protein
MYTSSTLLIVNATQFIPPEDLEEVLFEGRLDREQRVAAYLCREIFVFL